MARRSQAERSRRRFSRRQWARRWLVWRYLLVGFVVLALAATGVWFVYFSDTLSVQGVDVVGADSGRDDEVLVRAAVPLDGPLATADLEAIETRVRSLDFVASVDVTREWPHDVRISVVERVPVAVVRRGELILAVDKVGKTFNSYKKVPAGLPLIETDDVNDTDALEEAVTVVDALPPEVASVVDHLDLVSSDQIDLVLDDERQVHWGSSADSDNKGEVLLVLLKQKAGVYDVSVPGTPTISGTPPEG